MKTVICGICKRKFIMGRTGTVDGCDACQGIQRDDRGYFWLPNESEMELQDVITGEVFILKRSEAFSEGRQALRLSG